MIEKAGMEAKVTNESMDISIAFADDFEFEDVYLVSVSASSAALVSSVSESSHLSDGSGASVAAVNKAEWRASSSIDPLSTGRVPTVSWAQVSGEVIPQLLLPRIKFFSMIFRS